MKSELGWRMKDRDGGPGAPVRQMLRQPTSRDCQATTAAAPSARGSGQTTGAAARWHSGPRLFDRPRSAAPTKPYLTIQHWEEV